MLLEPKQLHNIFHPFINSMYIKKEFSAGAEKKVADILVIDANLDGTAPRERKQRLFSFLADLDLLRDRVEQKVGKINRIDIRCH